MKPPKFDVDYGQGVLYDPPWPLDGDVHLLGLSLHLWVRPCILSEQSRHEGDHLTSHPWFTNLLFLSKKLILRFAVPLWDVGVLQQAHYSSTLHLLQCHILATLDRLISNFFEHVIKTLWNRNLCQILLGDGVSQTHLHTFAYILLMRCPEWW